MHQNRVSARAQKRRDLFDAVLIAGSLAFMTLVGTTYASEPQSVHAETSTGWFDAAREGDVAALQAALRAGAQMDSRDERGSTALILAAYYGKTDAVSALLAAGADPNLGDTARGNTALMGALFRGEEDVAKRLLAHAGTDPDARNLAGQTAAMFAALFKRDAIVDALAARGADFSVADARGYTAEQLARQQGSDGLANRILALASTSTSRDTWK